MSALLILLCAVAALALLTWQRWRAREREHARQVKDWCALVTQIQTRRKNHE
ncbi:MAG: hypothetical protein H3C27_08610 [Opitutaceae bacterium]|nr:hypothetical protein [Opitutaceae bacterium]